MTDINARSAPAKARGRPREFDINTALDRAAEVFSERGFHATSIVDLTTAMGLASGSVYKAFKDKQSVFTAAFDHQQAARLEKLRRVVSHDKSARDIIHCVLTHYADLSHGAEGKRGCMLVGSAATLTTFESEVAQRVTASLRNLETLLANLIRVGQKDGSIRKNLDSDAVARLMLCIAQGMRVIGKTGRTRAQMREAADAAMGLLD
ncbi:MAG TPA: TetR/AcrR family transcriptional regulator [Paraburkholderia sp.]|jgi:TetR/AcrR family transcriptional repressor of nem operon|nr:TetR/AcrR family transcriptional regulator [Paraburkholderia sp.]